MIHRLLLRLEPETAHDLAIRGMRLMQPLIPRRTLEYRPREMWGLHFRNPLGIAAGFDKNAEVVRFLEVLGFGFVEVGTVTLQPQSGNPRPRIFRYRQERALVNRLGFNNDGARRVAERLKRTAAAVPVFVNVGKNADVAVDRAEQNYVECYRIVAPHADGVVVNVSSPNTPGLRELQDPAHLQRILNALRSVRPERRPILVKIAPDLSTSQLREIAEVCGKLADGIVATNTTVERPDELAANQSGGLSGAPLFQRSTEVLRGLRGLVGPGYPLVGVGGIFTAADARTKLEAGADLVQVYTGFVYGGPAFARRLIQELQG
jgi:dihydroorotate dehydrogenase